MPRKTKAGRAKAKGVRGKADSRRKRPAPATGLAGRLARLFRWSLVLAIWGFVLLGSVLAWYATDLPDIGGLARATRQPSISLLAADGSPISSTGEVYGRTVKVAQLPPVLPHAVLAVEDRRFYRHFGIDLRGLARAVWVNLRAGEVVQGGSTITQQLAKVLFLTPERTLKRKVQEALLALWLERKFSKDEILALYLNRVYLGSGTYGVDAAARRYFDKAANDVSLYEAAQLAGLLKAPSRYNPVSDYQRAGQRTRVVLNAMVEAGFVTPEEARHAEATKPARPRLTSRRARYYADWVMAQIGDYVGRIDSDLTVVTTLDSRLQNIAEDELVAILAEEGARRGADQAAFVALTPDGAVRAMVGGRDYVERGVRLSGCHGGRLAARRPHGRRAGRGGRLAAAELRRALLRRRHPARGLRPLAQFGIRASDRAGRPRTGGRGGAASRHHQRSRGRPQLGARGLRGHLD
jgi:penicillin-binding protein 1A